MKKLKISFLIVLVFSCSKDEIGSNIIECSINNFPMKEGNWWKYISSDLFAGDDTITLKIISKKNSNDTPTYFCHLIDLQNQVLDSGFFIVKNNRIEYKGANKNQFSSFGNLNLQFPFNSNSTWIGIQQKDTVKVVSYVDSVKAYNIKYDSVFNIKRSFTLFGGYNYIQNISIKRNIGIIKNSFYEYDNGSIEQKSYFLIDFHLN